MVFFEETLQVTGAVQDAHHHDPVFGLSVEDEVLFKLKDGPHAKPGELGFAVASRRTDAGPAGQLLEGGVRGVEIGTVMFGLHPDGTEHPGAMDLVRLAIPRRVYTQSHIDYVGEVVAAVAARRDTLRGYRIVKAPSALRHFTAQFAPLGE